MNFCPQCGTRRTGRFCGECGFSFPEVLESETDVADSIAEGKAPQILLSRPGLPAGFEYGEGYSEGSHCPNCGQESRGKVSCEECLMGEPG